MSLDLTGVKAKLARSAEHAQAVKNEVRTWMDRNPYSVLQKVNADSTRYSVILRVNEAPAIYRWSLMIADCIHNLRCVLDHLVYAIACHEATPKSPSHESSLQFPITNDRADFDNAVICRRQLGTISDPVRAAIQFYQPYNRPHRELPPLLSILRTLSNRDKHKLPTLVMSAVATGNLGFVGDIDPNDRNPRLILGTGEIVDGTEVCAITFDRPTPNMKYDRTIFDVIIAIQHAKRDPSLPEGAGRTDFVALLDMLSAEVRIIMYEVSSKIS
jgi:hypothetical protein